MSENVPKPNSGEAVTDIVAAGQDHESQASWLERNNVKKEGRIMLKKASHVRYQHPDLDEISKFLGGVHYSLKSNYFLA